MLQTLIKMMAMLNKKWLLLAVCQVMVSLAWAQDFTIKGKIPPAYFRDTLQLYYTVDGVKHLDTITMTNGSFMLTGKVNKPEMAFLSLVRHEKSSVIDPPITFYIEPKTAIEVTGNINWKEFNITGGPLQQDWNTYSKLSEQMLKGFPDYTTIDFMTEEGRALSKKWTQQYKKAQNAFIVAHPSSFISWDLVKGRTVVIDDNPYVLEALMEVLDTVYQKDPAYAGMLQRVTALKNIVIGRPAPDFESVDTLGKKHTLADFRGKYVLLDFWASWCGFCRFQLPELTRVYEKYKNNNFMVVGVAYDDSKEKWMKAIREDKTPFMQISELKSMRESPSAKAYGIMAIPQNILLDPDGNIVARNIGMLDFDKQIGEILNRKMTAKK